MPLILLALLAFPLGAVAQIIPALVTPVQIEVIPTIPAPGETITLRAVNVSNRDTASYVWTVDGRVADQGVGRREITITAGALGELTEVVLSVSDNGRLVGEVAKEIIPAEVDLVWEGNTYVPPFYQGLPLPHGDSTVTIAAIPNMIIGGARVAPDELVYEWRVDGKTTPFASGLGLATITLAPPVFSRPFSVSVVARMPGGAGAARESVTITPTEPRILVYEEEPLLGVRFDREIGGRIDLAEEEITLRAFPLFVSNVDAPEYEWRVNESPVSASSDSPRTLTLRRTGEGSGLYTVSITLKTAATLFERAAREFSLAF